MTRRREETVLAGFEVGTGAPVRIPLAHTFVTGQTQLSGKTTTLRAIVVRSGRRALAFVTKRGEQFEGRRLKPFLPRQGDQPIHWRLVETILASALGQRAMKYERYWIINAARGAKSLEDVRSNVSRLLTKAKGNTKETYELIGEYLDLVLPEMRELDAADTLDLQPGLNVMDLVNVGQQLQAMVIRACLERINQHESNVLTVFPEAWEFAPRGRVTPASAEAVAMARKGAVLGNFLLCDSQDIAGVDTVIRQAASVWILGVQRELNELKRTLAMIPASIKKPKLEEITSLDLGQFIACWGSHAVRTYVQPAWMGESAASAIARGEISINDVGHSEPPPATMLQEQPIEEASEPIEPEPALDEEEAMSPTQEKKLDEILAFMKNGVAAQGAVDAVTPAASPGRPLPADEDALYQMIKARLQKEAPALLKVLSIKNELEVTIERKTIEADESGALGMIAILLSEGFFKNSTKSRDAWKEMGRRWNYGGIAVRASEQLDKLTAMGFVTKEGEGYKEVPGMKVNIKRK